MKTKLKPNLCNCSGPVNSIHDLCTNCQADYDDWVVSNYERQHETTMYIVPISNTPVKTKKELADFIEELDNKGFYDEAIWDMQYCGSLDPEKLLRWTKEEAEEKGIELTDEKDCDYEMLFWDFYKYREHVR